MFKREKRVHELEKLNLVPIMDAVFIFIFFLLFSAQFIKIYEIETDAPLVSEVPEKDIPKKDPLNLTIKVFDNRVILLTGYDQVERGTFYEVSGEYLQRSEGEKSDLKSTLINLRKEHPEDDYAILAPLPSIEYDKIVKLLDIVQTIPAKTKVTIEKKGKRVFLSKIFQQVVLEPIGAGQ